MFESVAHVSASVARVSVSVARLSGPVVCVDLVSFVFLSEKFVWV